MATEKKISCKTAAAAMRKAHGEMVLDTCRECCNCQKETRENSKLICIAFGGGVAWDPNERACANMFNVAFRGLRPRQRTLYDYLGYGNKKDETPVEQVSLF